MSCDIELNVISENETVISYCEIYYYNISVIINYNHTWVLVSHGQGEARETAD